MNHPDKTNLRTPDIENVNVTDFDLFGQILEEDVSIVGVDLNFHVERSFKNDTERWVLGHGRECGRGARCRDGD